MEEKTQKINEKIQELENTISDLKKRWPAHSLKPEMYAELEDLEEELEKYKKMKEA